MHYKGTEKKSLTLSENVLNHSLSMAVSSEQQMATYAITHLQIANYLEVSKKPYQLYIE